MISLSDTRSSVDTAMMQLIDKIRLSSESHGSLLEFLSADIDPSNPAGDGDAEALDVYEAFSNWMDKNQEG